MSEGIIEVGEYVYGFGAHGGESEACYLARTRASRKRKLKSRGLVFDETSFQLHSREGIFFCIQGGHHFRANIEKWTNNNRPCPYCTGEQSPPSGDYVPFVDQDDGVQNRKRWAKHYLDVNVIQDRLEQYKCRVHDESKFIKIRDPIDLECITCGEVWHSPRGVELIMARIYSHKKKDPSWSPPYPLCRKCHDKIVPPRRMAKRGRHFDGTDGRMVDVADVNRRLVKWQIVCTHFVSIRSEDNKWRCDRCGNEWVGSGTTFVHDSTNRKSTPCPPCREVDRAASKSKQRESQNEEARRRYYAKQGVEPPPRDGKRGRPLTIKMVNKRIVKWDIECIRFSTVATKDNKWRCKKCGNEWEEAGNNFVHLSSGRVHTPCTKCNKDKRNTRYKP